MGTIDLSKFTPTQIALAFGIVIAVVVCIGTLLPKVINAFKNIWKVISNIAKQQQEKEDHIQQIRKNSADIQSINDKIDNMLTTLDTFIVENKETNETIIQSVQKVNDRIDDDEIDRIRNAILRFADELKENRFHSSGQFKYIISLSEKYGKMIREKNLPNGVFEVEFGYIKRTYDKLLDDGKFVDEHVEFGGRNEEI